MLPLSAGSAVGVGGGGGWTGANRGVTGSCAICGAENAGKDALDLEVVDTGIVG